MRIDRIIDNKKRFLDLLLLADEQEDMIDKYLPVGDLFALYDRELRSDDDLRNDDDLRIDDDLRNDDGLRNVDDLRNDDGLRNVDDLRSVCVVVPLDSETCELKNIATYPQYQGKGYGRALISFISDFYKNNYKTMLVGTGETPAILSFYESCGFVKSHRVKNFFTDNYDHPMFEGDIQLVDMVYLKKDLTVLRINFV
ncbi:MAG: GNAT family N-acetyltransferase [Bacteroidales bacterium]|nr:GNAT family N-acetyltransferase [Bacteroidales bacterium]